MLDDQTTRPNGVASGARDLGQLQGCRPSTHPENPAFRFAEPVWLYFRSGVQPGV